MIRPLKFSLGWCVGITFLHAAITLVLTLLLFVTATGSFTYGPGAAYHLIRMLLWIWSPFAMAAANDVLRIGMPTEALAVIWSFMVGIGAGFAAPFFIKQRDPKSIPPGTNPDLLGTPWERNPDAQLKSRRKIKDEHNRTKPDKPMGKTR